MTVSRELYFDVLGDPNGKFSERPELEEHVSLEISSAAIVNGRALNCESEDISMVIRIKAAFVMASHLLSSLVPSNGWVLYV